MSVFSRFRPGFARKSTDLHDQSTMTTKDADSAEKIPGTNTEAAVGEDGVTRDNVDRIDEDAQRGVRQVEAVTLSWSKWSLVAIFIKFVGNHTES